MKMTKQVSTVLKQGFVAVLSFLLITGGGGAHAAAARVR